jgi:hypothetical protein
MSIMCQARHHLVQETMMEEEDDNNIICRLQYYLSHEFNLVIVKSYTLDFGHAG